MGAPLERTYSPELERTPLLPQSQRQTDHGPAAPVKRTAKWVGRNVVVVFASVLILAVIILLCIFFGGM
jgi:endothelin-converting enzyme